MGGDRYDDEKPQHRLHLPEYQIGKYPETNAEFARFIEAGGYREQRWWTEAGWLWKGDRDQPNYWIDARFNAPNRPVVGVSWYEALAYCRWLSAETGQPRRLPSEAEWEKAARGIDGREYPWGNQFDASRLNASEGEQQVQTTTPVGIYPTGASPPGCLDMAGNVWEWTSSLWGKDFSKPEFNYPYNPTDGRENLEAGNEILRVVRGGSFYDDQVSARCASRLRFDWNYGDFDLGFRVLVSPISQSSVL